MKKMIACLLLMSVAPLCSCSDYQKNTSGIVECSSISISGLSYKYKASTSNVYEYTSSDDEKKIYTNFANKNNNDEYISLHVYANSLTNDYTVYNYSGLVGKILLEKKYFLDLDKNIIRENEKYSECLYLLNDDDKKSDNEKAYKCAKDNYYTTYNYSNYYPSYYSSYYDLYLDTEEKGLERNSYIKIGNDATVTYTVKK
jgi:hypothetical protein